MFERRQGVQTNFHEKAHFVKADVAALIGGRAQRLHVLRAMLPSALLHLVHFRVLSRDDGPPGPYDAGWKDTVYLEGGTVRVVARFDGYRGKYVFHCHNLEHEDMMMMANFEVV